MLLLDMSLSTSIRRFTGRARIAGLLAAALWIPAAALSQETPPQEPTVEPPEIRAIPLEDVQEGAEALSAELDAMLPGDALRQSLAETSGELERLQEDSASLVETTTSTLATATGVGRLQEMEQRLIRLMASLKKPDAALDAHLTGLRTSLDRIDALAPMWKETEAEARRAGASPALLRRIALTRREIDRVRGELVAWRNEVLTLREGLVDPLASLEKSLREVRGAIQGNLASLLSTGPPPIWSADVRASILEELKQGWTQHLGGRLGRLAEYAREHASLLAFQLALFIALALGLRALGARAKARAEESYDLREAERVFEHPTSMALVITLVITPELHPLAPPLFTRLASTVLVVPIVLIVRRLAPPSMSPLVIGIPLFWVVDQVRYMTETAPVVARMVFFLELLFALGLLLWLIRPSRLVQASPELLRQPSFRVVGVAMRLAIVLLALAVAAEGFGLSNLSDLLGNGTLRSTYAALLFYGMLKVAQSLVAYALVMRPLRLLRLVSRQRVLVRRHLDRALGLLAAAAWVYATLLVFGVARPLRDSLAGLLGAGLTVGALSISLGDVVVFVLVVWLSFALARLVNFVLDEDVFPRMRMARGVPYAISSLVRYTLIFLGFLVALAAAGIELGKLTVIAGGLGVGIGFGLQNVVNNFVSGLILLFERPVQVGDVVQLMSQDLWGEIRRIGIRASVIHTFDGAEVIVPNGQLVSEAVTNWTLSDRHRRVEVNVGVEYGTDAQRVIDLLLEVARSHPNLLETPPPRAFFLSFGDSALTFVLRGWIPDFNDGFTVRSELAVAVQRALAEAGIGVPFPQRDLHLRTVSPTAASELGLTNAPHRVPGDSDSES
jgi:small-conductance mechanosensitive channel